MRHLISTIAAVALASAVGVFAQEQQAPAQGPASSNEQAQKSTVTGCVVQAKTTAGDTVFVLSKAEGGSAPMYVLGGATPAEWSGHAIEHVLATQVVVRAPVLYHPVRLRGIGEQVGAGVDRAARVVARTRTVGCTLPGAIEVLRRAQVVHRTEQRPFGACDVVDRQARRARVGRPLARPAFVRRRERAMPAPCTSPPTVR